MNRRFPLATVLRVRQVQEDLAAAEVARLRVRAAAASQAAAESDAAVRGHQRPVAAGGPFGAASAVGLARAVDADLAVAAARAAQDDVALALTRWAGARGDRRGVERLGERHAAAVRAQDARAEQRALDERPHRPAAGAA